MCCNRCPEHGVWCTSLERFPVPPAKKRRLNHTCGGQLCTRCGLFPASKRAAVQAGLCCNHCPAHGPWCTRRDLAVRIPLPRRNRTPPPLVKNIFNTTHRGVRDAVVHLQEHGWAVLGPVFRGSLQHKRKLLWHDIHAIPGFPSSDRLECFPRGSCGYLVRGNNLPNGLLAWAVRASPIIRQIFAAVHNTNRPSEMCTAMDGIFLAVRGRKVSGLRLHRDAVPESRDLAFSDRTLSIQGIFSFTPVDRHEDSGTLLVPGSHMEVHSSWGRELPRLCQAEYHSRCIKPVVPQDHILLFNSLTVHGSAPQLVDRACGINRLAVPVQFMPKARRSQATLAAKLSVYKSCTGSFAKPDDSFREAVPTPNECAWAAKHGYRHSISRIPSRLRGAEVPEDIVELF